MAKKRRYNVQEFKERKRAEGSVDLEMEDGQVFTIDPVDLWPDEVLVNVSTDQVAAATALLGGAATYKKFHQAGGSAGLLLSIVGDDQDVTPGE